VGLVAYEQVREAVQAVRARLGTFEPKVGLILGSGLGRFAEGFESPLAIPYADIPHFPRSSVPGHAGRLVRGTVNGTPVIAMQGRVHFYEGYTPAQVIFPVRVLCAMGLRTLIVTNSAGGINRSFSPGDLMAITDHINLAGWSALVGPNDERLGPRFPDMTAAYDPSLTSQLFEVAKAAHIELKRGVYASLMGPAYETPAEIQALRILGADAVGMSTVPEVVAARHMGVRVVGISCITNMAADVGQRPLSHEEVAETANRVATVFGQLLTPFIPLAAEP
jgi:purine-nucleoside phosphorylase